MDNFKYAQFLYGLKIVTLIRKLRITTKEHVLRFGMDEIQLKYEI
jgi:hypothetical protein